MMLLLKTDDTNVAGVRKSAKHATDGLPHEIREGDTLLVQVTYSSARVPLSRVRYAMTFVRCYEDIDRESDAIWGHHWKYIIEGKDLYTLLHPFDIDAIKASQKNYGQGVIRFAYVDPMDEAVIRAKYLARA